MSAFVTRSSWPCSAASRAASVNGVGLLARQARNRRAVARVSNNSMCSFSPQLIDKISPPAGAGKNHFTLAHGGPRAPCPFGPAIGNSAERPLHVPPRRTLEHPQVKLRHHR